MQRDYFQPQEDRLAGRLAASLEPKLRDALDHPIRRELLRALNRCGQPRSTVEIRAELRAFRPHQLHYHLQVLRHSGVVAPEPAGNGDAGDGPRYASEVVADAEVRAVLRATEGGDREQMEAAAIASASPVLTMFRTPRPVRTIRLRGRARTKSDRSSE